MSREEFLKELEYLLADLEEEEREEALDYYRDYLEESGDLTPEEIAGRLGSPEKVAAEIKGACGEMTGEENLRNGDMRIPAIRRRNRFRIPTGRL